MSLLQILFCDQRSNLRCLRGWISGRGQGVGEGGGGRNGPVCNLNRFGAERRASGALVKQG